jgi:hypothetical protein
VPEHSPLSDLGLNRARFGARAGRKPLGPVAGYFPQVFGETGESREPRPTVRGRGWPGALATVGRLSGGATCVENAEERGSKKHLPEVLETTSSPQEKRAAAPCFYQVGPVATLLRFGGKSFFAKIAGGMCTTSVASCRTRSKSSSSAQSARGTRIALAPRLRPRGAATEAAASVSGRNPAKIGESEQQ